MTGRVLAVRGTVVDARFEAGLPTISAAVRFERQPAEWITAVVRAQLDRTTVRTIALESTRGLRRGSVATWDAHGLSVPTGQTLLGRVTDLQGRAIDGVVSFWRPSALVEVSPPGPSRRVAGAQVSPADSNRLPEPILQSGN